LKPWNDERKYSPATCEISQKSEVPRLQLVFHGSQVHNLSSSPMLPQIIPLVTSSEPFSMLRRIFCGNLKDYRDAILESPSVWKDLTCGVVNHPPIPNWIIVSSEISPEFSTLQDNESGDHWEEDVTMLLKSQLDKWENNPNSAFGTIYSTADEDYSHSGSSYTLTPNSWQQRSVDEDESTMDSWYCEPHFFNNQLRLSMY